MSICDFLLERLEAKKAQLLIYEASLATALATYAMHSLDTGQTRQSITTHSIGQLRSAIKELESEIVTLSGRIYGTGASQGRPGW
jgi:poly(3-hydroxybutyrate) depolymerase